MPFDRKTLVIPDETKFEEHLIVTNGDIIVADNAGTDFGFKTYGRIFVGERAQVKGEISSEGDIYIDMFSRVGGNVSSNGNVYLGDKVVIEGKLSVKGDLDVGDNVEIRDGFEAKGWINIRSPIPLIIYIFIYLLQLLRLGRSEEIEKILEELERSENKFIPISEKFLFIPSNAYLGIQNSKTSSNLLIGKKCRVIGNFNAPGLVNVGEESVIYGSIKTSSDIVIGKKVEIHGNLEADGDIYLGEGVKIHGDVEGDRVFIPRSSHIEGKLLARKGVLFEKVDREKIEEKLIRFNSGADVVDEIKGALE